MKRAFKISIVSLVALLAAVTLQAQNYNDATSPMQQGGEYDYSYDEVGTSQRREAKPRWVEKQYPGGDSYKGYQVGGQNHGLGTYLWSDGSRYEGEFSKDSFAGYGVLYMPDGRTVYEGEFKNSQPHGLGTFYYTAGSRYVGEWANGVECGTGILYDADSRVVYFGAWNNGKPNGKGVYNWADGRKYIGAFRDGKSHGKGTLYGADGKVVFDGEWKDDKPVE